MDLVKYYTNKKNGFTTHLTIPTVIRNITHESELNYFLCVDPNPYILNVTTKITTPVNKSYRPKSSKLLNGNGLLTFRGTISIKDTANIVISNCIFDNQTPDKDCINIDSESRTLHSPIRSDLIWILDNKFVNTGDGAIDIISAKRVNVQGNHFEKIQKACLWGRSNAGTPEYPHNTEKLITHTQNYYESCDRRMPLLRGGYCHSFNNVITNYYAAGVQIGGEGFVLSENNWYGGKCPLFKRSEASKDFDIFHMGYSLGVEDKKEVKGKLNYWSRNDVETIFGKVDRDPKYFKDITMDFIQLFTQQGSYNEVLKKMTENYREVVINSSGVKTLI